MVLFLNRWYKKFLADLLRAERDENFARNGGLDKYDNRIPKKTTIKGLLNCLNKEQLMEFVTPVVSQRYDDKASNSVFKDGFYFHKSKTGETYVYYEVERGCLSGLVEDLDPYKVFGSFLLCYLRTFNHWPKDGNEYLPPPVQLDI
ncbi:MAG: hypothetical protein M9899_05715 [Bdellovibrionaceae bacterium]|nr:hypothetical protein [Pseudobdellovibrionaceae bacterium]